MVHCVIRRTDIGPGMEANTERCRRLVPIAVLPAQEPVHKMPVLPLTVGSNYLLHRSVFDVQLAIPRTPYFAFW